MPLFALAAAASTVIFHVGPPSLGTGGANPISLPPVNIYEYELEYVTQSDWEADLAIIPGVFVGKRSRTQGGGSYVSFGGGYAIDANGSGPGVYSALGYDYGKTIAWNFEFKQAIGYDFSKSTVVSPYALRIGAAFNF